MELAALLLRMFQVTPVFQSVLKLVVRGKQRGYFMSGITETRAS